MRKRWVEGIAVYGMAIAVIGGLFAIAGVYAKRSQEKLRKMRSESMSGVREAGNGGTKVKICRVFTQPLTDVLKLPGTVEAYDDIDLAVKMGGSIEWIGYEEGDRVRKGEKLLQLDVALIEAQVQRALASRDLAKLKYDRMKGLPEKGVVSPDFFDDVAASLKMAEAALTEARTALKYGTLYSPIDGVLDRRYVDRGEHVDSGETVMKIVDIDRVKVLFNIPEKDILYFKRGRRVAMEGFDFFSGGSNGQKQEFEGTVEFVAVSADRAARTYPLKVAVDNKDRRLRPGMILRASLVRRRVQEGIAVPFFTIVDREDGKGVFVVEDGVARERPVEYGMFQGGLVEIVKGLEVGDRVVVVGQRNLVNGERVSVVDDLTLAAKAFLASGRDMSELALEMK